MDWFSVTVIGLLLTFGLGLGYLTLKDVQRIEDERMARKEPHETERLR